MNAVSWAGFVHLKRLVDEFELTLDVDGNDDSLELDGGTA